MTSRESIRCNLIISPWLYRFSQTQNIFVFGFWSQLLLKNKIFLQIDFKTKPILVQIFLFLWSWKLMLSSSSICFFIISSIIWLKTLTVSELGKKRGKKLRTNLSNNFFWTSFLQKYFFFIRHLRLSLYKYFFPQTNETQTIFCVLNGVKKKVQFYCCVSNLRTKFEFVFRSDFPASFFAQVVITHSVKCKTRFNLKKVARMYNNKVFDKNLT